MRFGYERFLKPYFSQSNKQTTSKISQDHISYTDRTDVKDQSQSLVCLEDKDIVSNKSQQDQIQSLLIEDQDLKVKLRNRR